MRESADSFHNLEWPRDGARLAGPVAWLRGWVVGKPGRDFTDIRVRHDGGTHLGVLGLPRTDLAAHFAPGRPWLPAEFILGVPVTDGPARLGIEVMDTAGAWHELAAVNLTITPEGEPPPRVEGRLEIHPGGSWTVRDAHHPCHGHLDAPGPAPRLRYGRAPVFGWLLDETGPLQAVMATTDTLVFNHLEHSLDDEALAVKVPEHPGARHARLRGAVDYPATLPHPACLRVYAVATDGAVTLCFAQRLHPTPAPAPVPPSPVRYPTLPARVLPTLPSGRPRRLLMVVRALLPDDASLRALDVARHLAAHPGWVARVVATEDGSLRREFLRTGVESLVVNPRALLAAPDAAAADQALARLAREIRWDHLDAVAVFDPLCGWALTLARARHIPTLLDCVNDEPVQPDATAIAAVQELLRTSWREATVRCFGSVAAARAQSTPRGEGAAEIIPQWHSPDLPAPGATVGRRALAPLRTADWLARYHPAVAARWRFGQGPAPSTAAEQLARHDEGFARPGMEPATDWSVAGLTLCLGPLFGRGPLRPVLDALAAGVITLPARRPTTEEFFAGTRLPLVDEANPLALAHALLAHEANPAYLQAETAAAGEQVRAHHNPAVLLPRWIDLLNRAAATRG